MFRVKDNVKVSVSDNVNFLRGECLVIVFIVIFECWWLSIVYFTSTSLFVAVVYKQW